MISRMGGKGRRVRKGKIHLSKWRSIYLGGNKLMLCIDIIEVRWDIEINNNSM